MISTICVLLLLSVTALSSSASVFRRMATSDSSPVSTVSVRELFDETREPHTRSLHLMVGDRHLRLKREDVDFPVYTADDSEHYKRASIQNFRDRGLSFYSDPSNRAVLAVSSVMKDGLVARRTIEGYLNIDGEDIFVSPSERDFATRDEMDDNDHDVFAVKRSAEDLFDDVGVLRNFDEDLSEEKRADCSGDKYVRIQLIVDNAMFKRWGGVSDIHYYIAHFILGVDLRFQSITSMSWKLKMRISSLVISKTANSKIEQRLPKKPFSGHRPCKMALTAPVDKFTTKYAYEEKKAKYLPDFDHLMLLTGCKLDGGAGYSYLAAVCKFQEWDKSYLGGSVVQTMGALGEIGLAAHELGHNLGADHDGQKCGSAKESFIMTPAPGFTWRKEYRQNPWKFSQCSIERFNEVCQKGEWECLKGTPVKNNVPSFDSSIKKYPGEKFSLEEQCHQLFGKQSKYCADDRVVDNKICEQLYCTMPPKTGCFNHPYYAMKGTPCGAKKWCIKGRCVAKGSRNDEPDVDEGPVNDEPQQTGNDDEKDNGNQIHHEETSGGESKECPSRGNGNRCDSPNGLSVCKGGRKMCCCSKDGFEVDPATHGSCQWKNKKSIFTCFTHEKGTAEIKAVSTKRRKRREFSQVLLAFRRLLDRRAAHCPVTGNGHFCYQYDGLSHCSSGMCCCNVQGYQVEPKVGADCDWTTKKAKFLCYTKESGVAYLKGTVKG